jgi:hypothetical protein
MRNHYDTGGMRRTHLRGHRNILNRLLIHVGAFHRSLIFRSLLGSGTPRELRNRQSSFLCVLLFLFRRPSVASSPRKPCVSSPPFDRRKNYRYLRYRLRYLIKCISMWSPISFSERCYKIGYEFGDRPLLPTITGLGGHARQPRNA